MSPSIIPENKKRIWIIFIGVIVVVIVVILVVMLIEHKPAANTRHELPQQPIPMTGISIGGVNGTVQVFGAVLSSSAAGILTATGTVRGIEIPLTITTDSKTTVRIANATSSVDNLKAGDILIVSGTLQSFVPTFSLVAKDIRVVGTYDPTMQNQPAEFPVVQDQRRMTATSTQNTRTSTPNTKPVKTSK